MKTLACLLISLSLAGSAHAGAVTGKWKMAATAPDGQVYQVDLYIVQEGANLGGRIVSERGEMPLTDVTAANDDLSFKLELNSGAVLFKLKVDGEALKGSLTTPDGGNGAVTAKRDEEQPVVTATGKWAVTSKDASGSTLRVTLALVQKGEVLTGEVVLENGDVAPISEGKAKAGEISFKIAAPEGDYTVTGAVTATAVKGTYKSPNGVQGTFSGQKQP